jgi:hypothetical protein
MPYHSITISVFWWQPHKAFLRVKMVGLLLDESFDFAYEKESIFMTM